MNKDRMNLYKENHCWQYDIRKKNLEEDIISSNIPIDEIQNLTTNDFKFSNIVNRNEQKKLKLFIERHEWLGNLSQYTTHWFGCYYKNILSGVILFNVPNAFSKLIGENTKEIERLISRGACISWSPKNLASKFLMWCIKWMVKNTEYRLFTAYSDPIAKEIGTIYQACNFYYLGQLSGTNFRYISPYSGKIVSDRYFRQKTIYKKIACELGIAWNKNYNHSTGMNWENIPKDVELKLREHSKIKQNSSEKIFTPSKHKYAFVLGRNKYETKKLRKLFEERNKLYSFPKERGV